LVVGCCLGGWFAGKAFVGDASGTVQGSFQGKRNDRSAAPDLAVGTAQRSWMEKVRKARPSDFPVLLGEMEKAFPEGFNGYESVVENATRWFYAMWMVKDRDGFLRAASHEEFNYSYWAAQALVTVDPEWAMALLRDENLAKKNIYFAEGIASALAGQQPEIYLAMNPDGNFEFPENSSDDWEIAIKSLAKTDARAAANKWLGWDVENATGTLCDTFPAIAEEWKVGDGSLAAWVDGISDPRLRNLAHHMRISAMAKDDPHAALAELYRAKLEDDNYLRMEAPREVLSQLAKADPFAALKLMMELEGEFAKGWDEAPFANYSPQDGSNPFSSLGPGRYSAERTLENNGVRHMVLRSLAESLPSDPALFWEKLQGFRTAMGDGASDWQRGVEAGLIRVKSAGWQADVCLQAATRWAAETGGAADDETYRNLAKRAAWLNPDAVMAALGQLPEAARGLFAAEAIKRLPDTHAEQRIALLGNLSAKQWDTELGSSLGRNAVDYAPVIAALPVKGMADARKAFASQWADLDPEAAGDWAKSLPDDAGAKATASGLVAAWASYDEYAASAWVANLPAGQARDGAAASLVGSIARGQPEAAWQWATAISDSTTRAEALTSVAYYWRGDTPPEMREEMNKARLAAGLEDRNFMFEESDDTADENNPFAE